MGNPFLKRLDRLGASIESASPTSIDQTTPEQIELPSEEHSFELDQYAATMEHATGVHERLSSLATTLESMVQTNGMSDTEYALFNHAVDGICADTPIDTAVPSMESFAHASDRLRNASVALESVGDKLKHAGEWIKKTVAEFLRKLAQVLQNWVQSIDPTIKKIESRDLSILSRLPRDVALEVELSDTNILRLNHDLRTGDYTTTLKKMQRWINVFTDHIAPNSLYAVDKLLESTDPDSITSDTVKDAISEAYREVKFHKKDDHGTEVSEELFGSLVLERQAGGYMRVETDLSQFRSPGRIVAVDVNQAEQIQELSVDILRSLKVMTNVMETHRDTFDKVSRTFRNSPNNKLADTIIRAIMSNTNDVILRIYRESLIIIRTLDGLVVSSLTMASQQTKDSQ